jgi:hypothetical protein
MKSKKGSLKYIIVLLVIGVAFVLAVQGGYVPIGGLSEPEPFLPIGIEESQTPSLCTVIDTVFNYIPAAENLTHETFKVDESPYEVMISYRDALSSDGYSIYVYEGTPLFANVTIGGIIFSYGAFVKGFTAVVVLGAPNETQGSCVLFTTGAIWEYQPIVDKLSIFL